MSDSLCPQCGAPSGFLTQGQLCIGCDVRFQIQTRAAFSQREAQRHDANMQAKIARDHAEMLRKQEEEEQENRLAEYESYLNSLPAVIEKTISSIKDDSGRLKALARIAEIFKDIDEAHWLWLRGRTQFEASVTYDCLRNLLHPSIVEWWQVRDSMSPSPVPMLKVIARSLRYRDLEGIRIAQEELPVAIQKVEAELAELRSMQDRNEKQVDKSKKALGTAMKAAAEAKDQLAIATTEHQKPIDMTQVSVDTEKKLRSISLGGKIAFGIAGLCLLGAGRAAIDPEHKGETGGILLFSMISFGYGIYAAWKAKKMRELSVVEFKTHLENRIEERTVQIATERKEALNRAASSLSKTQKQLVDTESELKKRQDERVSLESKVSKLQERIKAIPDEMLKGKIDPFFQSLLES